MAIYILIAGVTLLLIFIARKPRPVQNRQGSHFNEPVNLESSKHQHLIIGTYNVQTGKSLQGQRDINRAAEVIKGVDIVGVQEVYAAGWLTRLGLGTSQTKALAEPGNFSWLFCPTRFRWLRENRGNAVFSKLPIKGWHTNNLPDQSGISFRNMTTVCFDFNDHECHFINTHLHTGKGKTEQLTTVLNEFDRYPRAILVGDFNLSFDHPELQRYLRSSDAIDAIAVSDLGVDEKRIDWILTRGWKVVAGDKLGKGISDHPYYQVTLELDSAAQVQETR